MPLAQKIRDDTCTLTPVTDSPGLEFESLGDWQLGLGIQEKSEKYIRRAATRSVQDFSENRTNTYKNTRNTCETRIRLGYPIRNSSMVSPTQLMNSSGHGLGSPSPNKAPRRRLLRPSAPTTKWQVTCFFSVTFLTFPRFLNEHPGFYRKTWDLGMDVG